jgi:hypothetical protein
MQNLYDEIIENEDCLEYLKGDVLIENQAKESERILILTSSNIRIEVKDYAPDKDWIISVFNNDEAWEIYRDADSGVLESFLLKYGFVEFTEL